MSAAVGERFLFVRDGALRERWTLFLQYQVSRLANCKEEAVKYITEENDGSPRSSIRRNRMGKHDGPGWAKSRKRRRQRGRKDHSWSEERRHGPETSGIVEKSKGVPDHGGEGQLEERKEETRKWRRRRRLEERGSITVTLPHLV